MQATSANWLDAPWNRDGFRRVPELVATETIARGDTPVRPLPAAATPLGPVAFEHAGRTYDLDAWLAGTSTDGICVLHRGEVVLERYLDGMRDTDTHLLMSCSKSICSLVADALARRGALAADDPVTRHLPELAGTAWEGATLQDLLDMRAGVAWDYDVDEYVIMDVSDYRTHDRHGTIPADTETWIRTIARGPHGHGAGPFRYCSLATDVLGWAVARAAGSSYPDAVSRELWTRIGAEADAHLIVDRSGFPLVEGGVCTTLRDLARVGLHCRDTGAGPTGPRDDLIAAFRASDAADPARPDAFYHDCWWVDDGAAGVYAALGMNGQALFIDRAVDVIVAKFSTFPDALDDDLFALQHAGLEAVCAAASRRTT